ncbi:MAG: HEAT repeat domain-containing protein, partial [Asgard group archaeon]|nr:HEAT repeat domain-containing protein [Asgard group archaeon]
SALGTLREDTKEAIETLIETIEKDRVLGVRLEATMALGNIKSRTALPALTKIASENNNALLRSWVIDAIRKIQK